jgi:opacity protein-like surface antigen
MNFAAPLRLSGCVLMLATASIMPVYAADSGEDRWQVEFTPYLFASGLHGSTGTQQVTADVNTAFSDIVKNLDKGFMGTLEVRRDRWGFILDGLYFKLKDQGARSWEGPAGIGSATGDLDVTTTMQMYQLSAAYRLGGGVATDLIVAGRYTQLDTDLNLVTTTGGLLPGGTRSLSASQSWWDPVIGVRVILPFAEHWSAMLYGDIGGFGVGSDITYQAIAGVNWQFSEHFSAKLGYRYLYQDYDNNGFVWKMAAYGPYIGVGIRF